MSAFLAACNSREITKLQLALESMISQKQSPDKIGRRPVVG